MHEAPFDMTHRPLDETLLQVALRAPVVSVGLHAYPAAHDTDIKDPSEAGDGVVCVYGPLIVAAEQSTKECEKRFVIRLTSIS